MLIKLSAAEGRRIAREGAPKSLKWKRSVWVCAALCFQGKSRAWSLILISLRALCPGGVVGSIGMAVQGLSLPVPAAGFMSQGQCRCLPSPLGLQLETATLNNKGKSWLGSFLVQHKATGFGFQKETWLPPKKKSIVSNIAMQRVITIPVMYFLRGLIQCPRRLSLNVHICFLQPSFISFPISVSLHELGRVIFRQISVLSVTLILMFCSCITPVAVICCVFSPREAIAGF